MHTNTELLAKVPRGTYVRLWSTAKSINEALYEGILRAVDMSNDTATLESTVYEGRKDVYDLTRVTQIKDARGASIMLPPDALLIDDYPKPLPPTVGWTGNAWLNPSGSDLSLEPRATLSRTPPGYYLSLICKLRDSGMEISIEGKLQTVDFGNDLVKLENTIDGGSPVDVNIDIIISIRPPKDQLSIQI